MKIRPFQYAAEVLTWSSAPKRQIFLPGLGVERVDVVVPAAEEEAAVVQQRRGLDRRRVEAPALAAGVRVPGDDEPVRAGLVLEALDRVHVRLVDDALADRRRRGRAAAQALAPVDLAGLGVQGEEEALLLGQIDVPVARRWAGTRACRGRRSSRCAGRAAGGRRARCAAGRRRSRRSATAAGSPSSAAAGAWSRRSSRTPRSPNRASRSAPSPSRRRRRPRRPPEQRRLRRPRSSVVWSPAAG